MRRRIWSIVLGAIVLVNLVFASPGITFAAPARQADTMTDIQSSWAGSQISKWIEKGLISGYADRTFKPNASISRAEFASIVNKVFGFKEQSQDAFGDVSSSKWYYSEISKAKSAGYITGFGDNTFKPEAPISRQEAAKMLYVLLQLKGSNDDSAIQAFKDYNTVPAWSKTYLNEIVSKGYINGYPDHSLRPLQTITRAEAVVILDKVIGTLIMDKGIIGGTELTTIQGNVTINTPDVTLKNTKIVGDLLLTAGVGAGEVTLDQVTVTGRTVVAGGGENSIHLLGAQLNELLVNKQPGRVRIVAEGNTRVTATTVKTGVKLEGTNKESGFDSIELDLLKADQYVDLSGFFKLIKVKNKSVVNILDKSEIAALEVAKEATASTVNLADSSILKQLTLNAAATVKGKGTISKAIINASGTNVEQEIKDYTLATGVSAVINGKEVGAQPNTAQQVAPIVKLPVAPIAGGGGGSTGGGGGGGGGGVGPQPGPVELPDVLGVFLVGDQLYAWYEQAGNYSKLQWDLIDYTSETGYETTYKSTAGLVGMYTVNEGFLPPAEYIAAISNEDYYDFLPSLLISGSVQNGAYYPAVYYSGLLDIHYQVNRNGMFMYPGQPSAANYAPLADGDLISVFYGNFLKLKAKWDGTGKKWISQGIVNLTPAPDQVTAAAVFRTEIKMNWKAVPGAEYYHILASSTGEEPYTLLKDSSGAPLKVTATSYTDGGHAPNTMMYYKIIAVVNGAESAISQMVSATTFSNEHMQLDLKVTNSVKDPNKPIIYVTDKQNKKLVAINYETRQTTTASFELSPESITYANGKLYVGLLKAEHSSYIFDEQQKGAVAVVDAATLTVDHIYNIDLDPYSIAADREGYVYVSSGSGQWTKILSYSGDTFTPVGSYGIRQQSHILMHPSMDKIYSVNTDSSPRDIQTFAIQQGQFTGNYDSPYHGNYQMTTKIDLSPDGKYLFNGAGTVFLTTSNRFDDMNYVYKMDESYEDLAFDLEYGKFYTVKDRKINSYNYSNFSKIETALLDGSGQRIFEGGDQLLALTSLEGKTILEFVDKSASVEIPPVDAPGIYLGGTVVDAVYDTADSKVYAIDEAFRKLIVVDTASQSVIQKVSLPYKPAGLTLSEDGTKLFIVNKDADNLVTEISLNDYSITRNVMYPSPPDSRDFSDRHIYNKSGRLYVVLGDWSPTLLVFDEATFQLSPGGTGINGVGEMVFSGDNSRFYYWSQYGWDAGIVNSTIYNYSIHNDGSLTKEDESVLGYSDMTRDPLDTPALLVESQGIIIVKNIAFNKDNLQEVKGRFPETIYAVDETSNTALGRQGIYDLTTFQKIESIDLTGAKNIFYDDKGNLYYTIDNYLFIH